jgi:hypothetical protein
MDREDTIVVWGSFLALGIYLTTILLERLQCAA